MGIGVLGFVLGLCLVAPSASSFGLADEGDRFGDEDDGFGFGGGGFRALELGGPPPMPRGGGLEFGLGGLLSALLSDNHPRPVHFAPMRFRMRGIRPGGDPFEAGRLAAAQAAGRQEARQSPFGQLFGFPPPHGGPGRHGPRRKVYPFPQDCEAEIVGKCTAIVRVCEGGMSQCTLECETDHPPQVSEKCRRAHPCAVEVERLCPIMSSRHSIFKCLLDHARNPASNISAECRASEPCLMNVTSPNCDLNGVGTHVFKRSTDPSSAGASPGEKHPSNPACSCKKKFLGFSGCGAHMSHPFCLPCGQNCVRNPACGSGASWCEVVDADKCPEARTFGDALDKAEGLAVVAKKEFPERLRKSRAGYRTCKLEKELGMGSFMKDLFGDMEESLRGALENAGDGSRVVKEAKGARDDSQKHSDKDQMSGSVEEIDHDIAVERAKLKAEKDALAEEQRAERQREATMASQLQEPDSALNTLNEMKFKEWEEKKTSKEARGWAPTSKWLTGLLAIGVVGVLLALVFAVRKRLKDHS